MVGFGIKWSTTKTTFGAAMATIDEHRALLHGRDAEKENHSILINLNRKVDLRR